MRRGSVEISVPVATSWTQVAPDLLDAIRAQYRLDWNGLHGHGHWLRVRENGLRLATTTGAPEMHVLRCGAAGNRERTRSPVARPRHHDEGLAGAVVLPGDGGGGRDVDDIAGPQLVQLPVE